MKDLLVNRTDFPADRCLAGTKSRCPDLLELLVVRNSGESCSSRVLCAQGRRVMRQTLAGLASTMFKKGMTQSNSPIDFIFHLFSN